MSQRERPVDDFTLCSEVGTIDGDSQQKGEVGLTARNWLFLFSTTLLWGAVSSVAVGAFLFLFSHEVIGWRDWLVGSAWNFGAGLMFSIASQMGFFAYLFVRQILQSWLRPLWLQNGTQLILIGITLIDLFYLRFRSFYSGENLAALSSVPLLLLVAALLVAAWKARLTNATACIPSIFYMVVFSVIESLPVLVQPNHVTIYFMLIPLLVCNGWQILQLHRLTGSAPSGRGREHPRLASN